ncbi:MAG: helix-turn-helix domain-containing protein [Acidimicrobiia bacterium]
MTRPTVSVRTKIAASDNGALAELIKKARAQAGLSQTELARRLGSKQPAVSRWETGEDEPRLSTLVRLLLACDLALVMSVEPVEVDRSQIRQQLALSPAQRLASVANLSRLRATARRRD